MWAGCWLWSSSFKYPNEQDDESWLSAQISADGKTLYYVEARRGKTTAYVTKRRTLGRPFDGDSKSFRLPGGHPRMTRDGLRQFWFDGETLFRSSRADVELAFSTLEWKTTSDTDQGGVYFHYKNAGLKDSGDLRKNAFKIQLAGDYSIRNTPDKFATGGLFGIKGPTSNAVKPNGQWNTLVLRVAENRVNAAVNGIEVLDTPASLRNIAPLGFICLDGEFPGISYRKMLVYELPQPLKR